MKTRTKLILAIGGTVLVIAGVVLAIYLTGVKNYQNTVANMTYRYTNAAGIPDGTYTGECDVQFIYAKVSVTVQNEQITSIVLLEHRNERGEAATGIEQQIVAEQRIDVDAVAGATNSSTVIKKAVDNALASAAAGEAT